MLLDSIVFPPPVLVFLLLWTFDMREKCGCAVDWKLTTIQILLFIFLLAPEKTDNPEFKDFIGFTKKPIMGLKLVYLPLVLAYLHELDKKNCSCTHGSATKVLFWVSCVQMAIFALALVYYFTKHKFTREEWEKLV